jgi:hypothetical protein
MTDRRSPIADIGRNLTAENAKNAEATFIGRMIELTFDATCSGARLGRCGKRPYRGVDLGAEAVIAGR